MVTTHLFWDPHYPQIKVIQSMYLLKAVSLLRERMGATLPLFITMDSNTMPYTYGYNYFCHWNQFIRLHSAYEHYYHNEEPLFTNFTHDFIGCLDYIFYNGGEDPIFELTGVEPLPEAAKMKGILTLPSASYPSDHIPIAMNGVMYSQKREMKDKEEPFAKCRVLMTQPFFDFVYCDQS